MLRKEQDYILRMIAAAAAAVGRLRERLIGGAQPDEIVRESRAAQTELLGKDAGILRALDPAFAVQLLGDKKRLEAWADLLRVEAEAHRKAGREDEASALERRAHTLLGS
jgi:hypothetical protein